MRQEYYIYTINWVGDRELQGIYTTRKKVNKTVSEFMALSSIDQIIISKGVNK